MRANSMQLRPGQTGICGPAEASGQNRPHQAHRHQQGAPLSQDLPPQGERGGRVRRTHSHSPSPAPSSTPSLQQHAPRRSMPPRQKEWRGWGRNWAGGKGRTKEGFRTGQTALAENGAQRRRRRKEERERIIVVVRSPCQEKDPADAHPSALKSVLESANPAWTRSVHLDAPGQQHGQQPVSGTADPGVVKQDKSSRALLTRPKYVLGPQRVRRSSGERPIGAAKASNQIPRPCANPPPPTTTPNRPTWDPPPPQTDPPDRPPPIAPP